MVDPRQKHIGKTKAEKRAYIQNILQPSEVTAEIPYKKLGQSSEDATIQEMSEEEQELYKRTRRPPLPAEKSGFRFYKFLLPIIITAAIAFLAWQARMLIGLNREVGEVRIEINNVNKLREIDSKRMDRLEDSLSKLSIGLIEGKPRK